MEEKLTFLEAYKAMLLFLDEYYYQFGQEDLGAVLGYVQLMPNGGSADPAAWYDWLEAVKRVLEKRDGMG